MSFHKRFYNWDKIKAKTSSTFNEFDMWLYKPDAHMLQDTESSDFFGAYFALPDDKLRENLYESLKVEGESFLKDLIKCIKVVHENKNGENHDEAIQNYRSLFVSKWDTKALQYQNLIEK
jgi:hypothetical protein